MTIEVVILSAIVVGQQAFYMWQVHKLINKLMSRDFFSYKQTLTPPQPNGFHIQLPDEGIDRLKELNNQLI